MRIELQCCRALETVTPCVENQIFRCSGVIESLRLDHGAVLRPKPATGVTESFHSVTQGIFKSCATVVNLLPGSGAVDGSQVAVVHRVRAHLAHCIKLVQAGFG